MSSSVLSFMTYQSVETILGVGGSQSWALNRARAKCCEYAVICRNAKTGMSEDDISHGTAFMVGRIADVVPSTNRGGRWLILFSEYALCDIPDQWEGRNPVAYRTTDDYPEINFEALTFLSMPSHKVSEAVPKSEDGLTIAAAKQGLATTFGVHPSAIEITIRG